MLPYLDGPHPGPSPWKMFVLGLALGALIVHFMRPTEVRVVRLRVLDGGLAAAEAGGN